MTLDDFPLRIMITIQPYWIRLHISVDSNIDACCTSKSRMRQYNLSHHSSPSSTSLCSSSSSFPHIFSLWWLIWLSFIQPWCCLPFSGLLAQWKGSSKLAQPELVEKLHHVQMCLICLGGISCSLSGNWWLFDGLCPTVSGWAGGSTVDGTTTWQLSHQFRPLPLSPWHSFPLPYHLPLCLDTVH